MTQLETPPSVKVDQEPAPSPTPPNGLRSSRFRWIALAVACVVVVGGIVAYAVRGSDSGSGSAKILTAAQVPVTVADFKVSVPATLSTGAKTMQINNSGRTQHELLVFRPDTAIDPNHLPLGDDGNINEDAPGVNKVSDGDNIDPGQTQARDLDLTVPGTYVFVCNLPGHYKLGMWTVVTVK